LEKSYRIDPAYSGIHLVDVENGMERVFIPYNEIKPLINELQEIDNE
jgi:hypothetical protein